MIFGNANGNSNGQQSNFNPLAQYLTSPPAGELSQLANGELDAEKKKWMLATGLGGMFTPGTWMPSHSKGRADMIGPSGEMIPQIRPDQMSPMQLEMLAREFDTDVSPSGLSDCSATDPSVFECRPTHVSRSVATAVLL